MSLPQTVAEVLSKHVVLEVESIDRMYLNVCVPQLQAVDGTLKFIRIHRGHKVASTHMVEPITRQFVGSIEQFAKDNRIPLITFEKGQRKDDFAKQQRKKFQRPEGVVFIGKAQEKCRVYRTEKRRNPQTKRTYPWIVKSTTLVNHYYFYCIDEDFGPFFLKFCSYFPYNAKLCFNGHEYLKRQLEQRRIAYQALENGILSCKDPQQLQLLCDIGGKDRHPTPQMVATTPPSLRQPRPSGRLPLSTLHPSARTFPYPGTGSARKRPHLL